MAAASTPAIDSTSAAAFLVSEAATLALARPQTPVAAPAASPIAAPPAKPAAAVPIPVPAPPASVSVTPVMPVLRAPSVALAPTGPSIAGQATWLDTIPTGTCANNDAPIGVVITVTNLAGTSITCRVVSRGPFFPGRIVDVAKSTFRSLASTSQGVVNVAVSW